ncbi:hypothetical protein [Janibacter cremeus]|uniref:Uncharacterized protein n=1 Tax=Janibacter cremeus TaxID=1285192 RepID=A0A852VM27_9MICO|nr:hypothetical protein [Janibacter cremeus]NYF98082.1 hypothetical protein [Janibacter cremeus]
MTAHRIIDRFDGRILGAGSSSGLRFVVGDWARSPLGAFTGVMVATADDRRILLARDEQIAEYVTSTYSFDEIVICPISLAERHDGTRWEVDAGPLRVGLDIGARTGVGRLLRLVPAPLARSRVFATVADPLARVVFPGVRTRGSAGNGRREYYGAQDQHAVEGLSGTWRGSALGALADVTPNPQFGFSSTPARPSVTRVTTTVVRG